MSAERHSVETRPNTSPPLSVETRTHLGIVVHGLSHRYVLHWHSGAPTNGMQGGGVCIRKISGFVKVTSRSRRTKVRSQIFYVCIFEGCALPYRGFQLPPCPGALSVSALRAGALALAPTCTVLRAGRGPGPTWHPARALVPIWGGDRGAFGPLFC